MFYIVEVSYTGPNRREHWDEDEIQIRTKPAITNMSKEEITEGWAGTTNDWRVDAHGEFETQEAAEAAIREKFGPVRDTDILGDPFLDPYEKIKDDAPDNPDIVAVYKAGELHPAHPDLADQWVHNWRDEVAPTSTDADLEAMYQDMEEQAREDGITFEHTKEMIIEALQGYRDECNDDD